MERTDPVSKRSGDHEGRTQALVDDLGSLAQDAGALMSATAGVVGEEADVARRRLTAALERGKLLYGQVRREAIAGAHAADKVIHEYPYQGIAIGVGIGALVGYFIVRRCTRNEE